MPLQAPWHVRIMGAHGPVGAGVLVDSRRIVTCAHVISRALNLSNPMQQPVGLITVDFPQCQPGEVRSARVTTRGWFPRRPGSGAGDLALLEVLGEDVRCTGPATLRPAGNDDTRRYGVLGHPDGHDEGTWARATITGVGGPGREWVQLESVSATGSRIQPGFSGGGLVDEETGTVVGVVVASDRSEQDRVAWMIPVEVICGYWPQLRALVEPGPAEAQTLPTSAGEVAQLTRLMLQLRGIADPSARQLFINAIETQFARRLQVSRNNDDFTDVTGLIYACLDHPGALHELVERLKMYHQGGGDEERLVTDIAAIAEGLDPAPLLDTTGRNKLYLILSTWAGLITADMVRAAYRSIAGPLSPEPIVAHDVESVIRVLESATTGADGLPPLLGFLEILARTLPDQAAREIQDWVDEFARQENIPRRLIAPLRLSMAPARPREVTSYLLAHLENFGADDERYISRVTLLQGDRRAQLPDARMLETGTVPLRVDDIPQMFDNVLDEMWNLPDINLIGELIIEFVLPLELLGEGVDQWKVQVNKPPHPLCVEHHVIVRYLGRPQAKSAYLQWQRKTERLRAGDAQIHWAGDKEMTADGKLFNQLFDPGAPCVVFPGPPGKLGRQLGADPVSATIWAGVPVIVWCRDQPTSAIFLALLRAKLGQQQGLALPDAVRQMRNDFIHNVNPTGEHITLVWDLEDEPTSLATRYQAPQSQ